MKQINFLAMITQGTRVELKNPATFKSLRDNFPIPDYMATRYSVHVIYKQWESVGMVE